MQIYLLFHSILGISDDGWDNEKLLAREPRLRFERLPPPEGLEPKTAKAVGYRLTY